MQAYQIQNKSLWQWTSYYVIHCLLCRSTLLIILQFKLHNLKSDKKIQLKYISDVTLSWSGLWYSEINKTYIGKFCNSEHSLWGTNDSSSVKILDHWGTRQLIYFMWPVVLDRVITEELLYYERFLYSCI